MHECLITAKEVSALLGISARMLEYLISTDAAPPHLRIGRLRRWQRADVKTWVEQQAQLNKIAKDQGALGKTLLTARNRAARAVGALSSPDQREPINAQSTANQSDQRVPFNGVRA